MSGNVAHGAGGFLALGLGVRHHAISAGLGAPPRGVAFAGKNVANLLGKPAEIVAQRLQILLKIARCGGGGVADFANAFARFFRRVSHGLRCGGGRIHGCTPCRKTDCRISAQRSKKFHYSGSLTSSDGKRWLNTTRPMIDRGEARKAPIGPHIQVQNASASTTMSGLSVMRRPTMAGVMKWPSSVVSAIKPHGAISAWPSEGKLTRPTANSTSTTTAGPT